MKKLSIERVKNSKGLYAFGFWFNIYWDEYFTANIGIAFIKSLHFTIYWE